MLRELAELREKKIRRALAAQDTEQVVKLTQRYLEVYDQCYPH